MNDLTPLKQPLHTACQNYIQKQIHTAQAAIAAAEEAANEETKSSAGDKYETGRAMMQLEKEKNETQLMSILELRDVLAQINPAKKCEVVELGSLVKTNQGTFYIAVGIGKLKLAEQTYLVISPTSPIGQALQGLRQGGTANFQGRTYQIEEIG